jgi:hypothetical protein
MSDETQGGPKSPEEWEAAKGWFFSGVSRKEIAERLGVSLVTVYKHAKRWTGGNKHGKTVKKGSRTAQKPRKNVIQPPVNEGLTGICMTTSLPAVSPESAPQDYQTELSQALKVLLAHGVAQLEPPRNWSEAKIANDMIRKADGLDQRDKGGPVSLLVNVGASLSRRGGVVVEAQEVEPETVEDWLV